MPVDALLAFALTGAVAGWSGDMLLKISGLGLAGDNAVGVIGGTLSSVTAVAAAGGTTSP
jgi:hypothetical protein